jgi:hypothetical protein
MKTSIFLCALVLALAASGPAAASIGTVFVFGINSDNEDSFAFVPLVNLPVGTVFYATDNGWQASGQFRNFEGTLAIAVSAAVAAGDTFLIQGINNNASFSVTGLSSGSLSVTESNLGIALSTDGDQVLVFEGSEGSPSFISAVDFDGAGYVDATNSNTTGLPPGLLVGQSALDLPEIDNFQYVGPRSGTSASLLTELSNPVNYSLSNSRIAAFDLTDFTIETSEPNVFESPEPSSLLVFLGLAASVVGARQGQRVRSRNTSQG